MNHLEIEGFVEYVIYVENEQLVSMTFKWSNQKCEVTIDNDRDNIIVDKKDNLEASNNVEWIVQSRTPLLPRPNTILLKPFNTISRTTSAVKSIFMQIDNTTDHVLLRWSVNTQHTQWKILPPEKIYSKSSDSLFAYGDGQVSGVLGSLVYKIENTTGFITIDFVNPLIGKTSLHVKDQWTRTKLIDTCIDYKPQSHINAQIQFVPHNVDIESQELSIFGLPLNVVLQKERTSEPVILTIVSNLIHGQHSNTVGLWTTTATFKEVQDIKNKLSEGNIERLHQNSIYSLCFVLKSFLRELTPQLIHGEFLERFLQIEEFNVNTIRSFMESLPMDIQRTLNTTNKILVHLHTTNNIAYPMELLSTIFYPLLFSKYSISCVDTSDRLFFGYKAMLENYEV